ncbi:hypothetical protein KKF81_07445 [Candidatus Micrarchaeota archaeon]|nr:hypothetical protein [Candidatus Micrarchaeota archaeon]MBU1166764.1 hypothetical protein [Candidatus Micrarchaeota archaeon]MBU1887238.1 hypothetical protein [Candidatus Micrarchaeota archaeon]
MGNRERGKVPKGRHRKLHELHRNGSCGSETSKPHRTMQTPMNRNKTQAKQYAPLTENLRRIHHNPTDARKFDPSGNERITRVLMAKMNYIRATRDLPLLD